MIFDGQTLSGFGPNTYFFTFDVTPGDIYNLQLSADVTGGDNNGNISSGFFQYVFDPALVPVSSIPEPSSLTLMVPGLFAIGCVIRRKIARVENP